MEACGKVQVLRRTPAGRRARAAAVLRAMRGEGLLMQKPLHKRTAGGTYGPIAMTYCGRVVKHRYTSHQWHAVTCKVCRSRLALHVLKEAAASE